VTVRFVLSELAAADYEPVAAQAPL
jgi:hypothetical protein